MIDTIATRAVDQNEKVLTDLAKKIWENPETAFNEVKACEWTAEVTATPDLRWRQGMWECPQPSAPYGEKVIR